VFLDTLVSLEEFFDKAYIPFDTEFVVAQSSAGSSDVSLTELYHVHFTLPLQMFPVGNWSSLTGLTWSSAPLARRRADLHGIVIKGALRPQVILNLPFQIPVIRKKSYEI
jgi:hypothetical protein